MAEALRRFEPPWIKVGRIYRRICFLRSEGLGAEASHMEQTELADAAAEARGVAASETEADSLLKTLLAEEEERVAEAIAFAEILVPILAERLSVPRPVRSPSAAGSLLRGPRAAAPGETRGIADFIDDMLAQDRAGSR